MITYIILIGLWVNLWISSASPNISGIGLVKARDAAYIVSALAIFEFYLVSLLR